MSSPNRFADGEKRRSVGQTRRAVVRGSAWSVPVVVLTTAAPAYAASCPNGSFSSSTPGTYSVDIPAGCGTITYTVVGGEGGLSSLGRAGKGAQMTGTIVRSSTAAITLTAIVGGGGGGAVNSVVVNGGSGYGAGGNVLANTTGRMTSAVGAGGGGSAILIPGGTPTPLVVAGGGGGGGGLDSNVTGCGATVTTPTGGSGGAAGSTAAGGTVGKITAVQGANSITLTGNPGGGAGAAPGNSALATRVQVGTLADTDWGTRGVDGGNFIAASGGRGADSAPDQYGQSFATGNTTDPFTAGGGGGGGYRGGGSGGSVNIDNAGTCWACTGAGGGAGSSYYATAVAGYTLTAPTFSAGPASGVLKGKDGSILITWGN